MIAESVHDLLGHLSGRYGEWCDPTIKPFSLNYRNLAGSVILKIYRGTSPARRQQREIYALRRAPAFGVKVPQILETGLLGPDAWIVVSVVPGAPLALNGPSDAGEYLRHVLTLTCAMAGQPPPTAPGDGWEDVRAASRISDHLVGMLRARVRETSWWPELRSRLTDVDGEPLVHLHGDIKPEHILVEDGVVHFVDWEACARGPAIQDLADAVFHAVRDFEYDGVEGDLLAPTLMTLPVSGGHLSSVLAWRVALWADRRCPSPVHRLPEQGMAKLLSTTTPADAVAALAQIIRAMRLIGTPR